MKFVKIVLSTALLLILSTARGQTTRQSFDEYRQEKKAAFERYRQAKRTEFEQYRQRLNEDYARLLESSWQTFRQEKGREAPVRPKPVRPVIADRDNGDGDRRIPVSKVLPPVPSIPDVPVTLPERTPVGKRYPVNFTFFNTPCGIEEFDRSYLSLSGTDNKSLTRAWRNLTADERLTQLTDDCLRLREEMQLCDWGYLLLVEKVSQVLFPGSTDSQALLTVAVLNQSGYDTRLGARGGRLGVLYHPSHQIYGVSYWSIDGKPYYLRGAIENVDKPLQSYPGDYRKSPTPLRMTIERYPRLTPRPSDRSVYSSVRWKEAPPFEIPVNTSVIDLYATYPQVDWPIYGLAPMSPELRSILLPVMQLLTDGMDKVEAVNLLLSFHNYGFEYMTDGDQFGREKPFFFDENYYYPYNDCEDRAIMFAELVRSVLGLDVVYLKYPVHLATAVRFPDGSRINGATVSVDGHTYYVCDPTCIGGKAGYLAPKYSNSTPEVHKIRP